MTVHGCISLKNNTRYNRYMEYPDMKHLVARFVREESGATAIEYGLIAAGISVAIILAVQTLGGQLNTTFGTIETKLGSAGK